MMSVPPRLMSLNHRINNIRASTGLEDLPISRIYSSKVIRLKLMHGAERERPRTLPNMERGGATSTPHVPFASTDLIGSFNNDTNRLTTAGTDDLKSNGKIEPDDTRVNGTSLGKHNNKNSFIATRERATLAEIRDLSTADDTLNSSHRSNYFKPMGIRNTFLTTKGISTNTTSQQTAQSAAVGTTGNSQASTQTQLNNNNNLGLSSSSPEPATPPDKDTDDLVAMGTNWAPPPSSLCSIRGPGRTNSLTNTASVSLPHNGGGYSQSNGSMYGVRRINKVATMPHLSAVSRHNLKDTKEPRYSEPLSGAPPSFHQRISELSNLESDTIRWERAKKFKRKAKEKDS